MDLGSTSPVLFALTGRQRTIRITPEFHLTFASSQDTCFALLSVEVITQGASKMLTDSERATTADVYLMHQLPLGEEMKRDLYTSQILDADSPGLPGKEDSPRYMRICPQTNNSQRQPPHHIPDECHVRVYLVFRENPNMLSGIQSRHEEEAYHNFQHNSGQGKAESWK